MGKRGCRNEKSVKKDDTSNSNSSLTERNKISVESNEEEIRKKEVETEKKVEKDEKDCNADENSQKNDICFLCQQIQNFISNQNKENEENNLKNLRDLLVKIIDKILLSIFEETLLRLNHSNSNLISNFRENIDIIHNNYGETYMLFIMEILLERISYILMVVYQKTFKLKKEAEEENLEKIKQLVDIDKNNKLMKSSVTTHNCKLFKCTCKINQLYYQNNIRKLEILATFENRFDHLFYFYNAIINASCQIEFVFSKYLKAISKEKLEIHIQNILKIEMNININSDKILKPLLGKINSIKHEFAQLENYKINSIIKEILFYNSPEELIKINEAIKKLYVKNPLYFKFKKPELIDTRKSSKEEEKTLDELLNFIINDNSFDKTNKKSKKKKKNKDCQFKNCFNNANFKTEEEIVVNESQKKIEIKENKMNISICDCDHFDIIVENFRTSISEYTVHSRFCNKIKPCFTKEWLERLIKSN